MRPATKWTDEGAGWRIGELYAAWQRHRGRNPETLADIDLCGAELAIEDIGHYRTSLSFDPVMPWTDDDSERLLTTLSRPLEFARRRVCA